MAKLSYVFSDSFRELKSIRTVTVAALFAAISVVLGYFTVEAGPYLKLGFSTIANQVVYCLFGPVVGLCYGGMLDILKYLIKPTGPYFPGFTLGAAMGGLIYGSIFYRHPVTLRRVLTAEFLATLVCNILLGTFWLTVLYGKGFFALLPLRIVKNLIQWPVNSLLFYTVGKTLEGTGTFRLLREPLR